MFPKRHFGVWEGEHSRRTEIISAFSFVGSAGSFSFDRGDREPVPRRKFPGTCLCPPTGCLRVTADNLDRLMALAGEALVASRWLSIICRGYPAAQTGAAQAWTNDRGIAQQPSSVRDGREGAGTTAGCPGPVDRLSGGAGGAGGGYRSLRQPVPGLIRAALSRSARLPDAAVFGRRPGVSAHGPRRGEFPWQDGRT